MIQQQTKLCFGAMKIVQWPTLVRGVSKALWPSYLKHQTSISRYSSSSTLTQVQSTLGRGTTPSDKEKENASNTTPSANGKEKASGTTESVQKVKTTEASPTATDNTTTLQNKIDAAIKLRSDAAAVVPEQLGKEMEAVLKVKSLAAAVEACANFSTVQRVNVLKHLVAAKARPVPFIQTLTDGIAKSSEDLNIKTLSDLLFTLAKLSYVNEDLLVKTCDAMKNQVKDVKNAAVLGSSISSLRALQWKDAVLLNEISLWLQNNFHKYENPSDFIQTLALQNHSPPNLEELLQLIWKDVENCSATRLINLVWSIHVLNCKSYQKAAKDTLNRFFKKRFLAELASDTKVRPSTWMKLVNLHGIARSSWGHVDFQVPESVRSILSNLKQPKEKGAMILEVAQFLFKTLDTNLYTVNVPSNMGFPIDMVFCLDEKMSAIPVHLATQNSTRVALMIHSYHECCRPTKEPNGVRAFEMKLLEEDYMVISVPYFLLNGGSSQMHEYFESVLSSIARTRR